MADPTTKPEKDTLDFVQFFFGLIGITVGVVVFAFVTFVTKSELEAKDRADEKSISYLIEDMREIKQDVKELLKNSKR